MFGSPVFPGLWAVVLMLAFLAGLFFLFVFLPVSLAAGAFAKLGLTPLQGLLVFVLTLLGRTTDIPLFRTGRLVRHFGVTMLGPFLCVSPLNRPNRPEALLAELREQTVAVNVGGCLIPMFVSGYLLLRDGGILAASPWFWLCLGLVAAASFAAARVVPHFGLRLPFWVPPVATVVTAAMFAPVNLAPGVAYAAGTLGALLGGNVLHYLDPRSMGRLDAPILSVGGAGTFGGVFLAGILSVLLS
ncbi:MAG TPA: DUF1614 domain-containing protein [Desulfovibrio sp.]|jgi:uncharacterized membrane protein|uniref:DUF1614 domain-containing protein n=1 Tax=Desulfovibrio TaxID=872 RepID=UPI000487DA59|nr:MULTISPECIES: DUF1614 domain-containing protein [Desulfovibrio]MDY0305712.1 DUF1614 domain-containing protein [Desulfovibrionaceae bacterium]HMM37305.1 DUF1614 domain-containing protein [Desulfovibrio sp.]